MLKARDMCWNATASSLALRRPAAALQQAQDRLPLPRLANLDTAPTRHARNPLFLAKYPAATHIGCQHTPLERHISIRCDLMAVLQRPCSRVRCLLRAPHNYVCVQPGCQPALALIQARQACRGSGPGLLGTGVGWGGVGRVRGARTSRVQSWAAAATQPHRPLRINCTLLLHQHAQARPAGIQLRAPWHPLPHGSSTPPQSA